MRTTKNYTQFFNIMYGQCPGSFTIIDRQDGEMDFYELYFRNMHIIRNFPWNTCQDKFGIPLFLNSMKSSLT